MSAANKEGLSASCCYLFFGNQGCSEYEFALRGTSDPVIHRLIHLGVINLLYEGESTIWKNVFLDFSKFNILASFSITFVCIYNIYAWHSINFPFFSDVLFITRLELGWGYILGGVYVKY